MLALNAKPFNVWTTSQLLWPKTPMAKCDLNSINKRTAIMNPSGRFAYRNVRVPAGVWLPIRQGLKAGEVCFSAEVTIPTLVEVREYESFVWMSMAPLEVFTQRPGLRKARGNVFIGGLGMGWFLSEVCKREQVHGVVVVEKDKELTDWLLPRILATYPHIGSKLSNVVVADAKKHCYECTADTYLFDIWSSYPEAGYDREFKKFQQEMSVKPARTVKGNVVVWGWGDYDDGY